jgi:type IV pilus assembly protein PilW
MIIKTITTYAKANRYSKGLTLLEMMISIALGMVVILGLTDIYLSTQKSARTRDAIANMEANARIALSSLRQIIGHAGYPSIYNMPLEKPFHTTEDGTININTKCRGGVEKLVRPASIAKKYTTDNGTKDRIVVKYMADNPDDANAEIIRDCTGSSVLPECSADPDNGMYNSMKAIVYNAIYITTPTGRSALQCAGSRNAVPQPLAEDISAIQFLYGVRNGITTSYKTATAVEAAKEWEGVISVQVAILVRSSDNILKSKEKRTFVLLDQDVSKNDKRLYRVYSTTINLPNRNRRVL